MTRGESRAIIITQDGIDVVIDVEGPGGGHLSTIDSPNGRHGDEPVEILSAADGIHEIVVRSLEPNVPARRYQVAVTAWRDVAAPRRWLADRAAARAAATAWLRERAGPIRLEADQITGAGLKRFDALARTTRVIGLGEATHGSRQIADLRLALTRRLVERGGVRLIA